MDYQNNVPNHNNPKDVQKFLLSTFTQLGFRIENKGENYLELIGPGYRNTRQSPLLGFSKINIRNEGANIFVEGELGGVKWMRKFLIWFIGGMFIFFMILFGLLFMNNPKFNFWLVVLPFAPWPFLIPFLCRIIEKRSRSAMDNLLHNSQFSID